jgi:hypothetical protein
MKKELLSKTLAMGVIVLFIGVIVQPAYANNISISIPDDTTPPIIEVTYEVSGNPIDGWIVSFIAEAYDEESGIDRVEMWINDIIFETIKGPGPCYTFPIKWCKGLEKSVFTFIAYNGAGLSAFDSIAGTDIKYTQDCDCQTVISDVDLDNLDKVFDRLESYRGLLSLLSKSNSKISEYYGELSNSISTITELEGENKSVVCVFLFFRWFRFGLSWALFTSLSVMFWQWGLNLLEKICEYLVYEFMDKFDEIGELAEYYECWWTYLL